MKCKANKKERKAKFGHSWEFKNIPSSYSNPNKAKSFTSVTPPRSETRKASRELLNLTNSPLVIGINKSDGQSETGLRVKGPFLRSFEGIRNVFGKSLRIEC